MLGSFCNFAREDEWSVLIWKYRIMEKALKFFFRVLFFFYNLVSFLVAARLLLFLKNADVCEMRPLLEIVVTVAGMTMIVINFNNYM